MPGRGGPTKNFYLPLARKHVMAGFKWGQEIGTDYWLTFNPAFDIMAAAATTVGEQLAENGWTATLMVNTAGAGQDFLGGLHTPVGGGFGTFGDAASPNHALTDTTGDILLSPALFGGAAHAWAAARILAKSTMPRYLIAEFWAAFTVASADEATSAVGFFEDGATASTEADQYAVIRSNGVNFLLQGNASAMVTGPVIALTWAHWKIILDHQGATAPNIYAYRNNTIFSATAGVGAADEFPLKFGLHALTTNRIGLGPVHIYYDW